MKIKKYGKPASLILLFTGIIFLVFFLPNYLALLCTKFFYVVIFPEETQILIRKIWDGYFGVVVPFAFFVPIPIGAWYLWPLYRSLARWNDELPSDVAKRRLLNAPLKLSLISMAGWGVSIAGFVYGALKYNGSLFKNSLWSFPLLGFLAQNLCVVATYYFMEFMSRRFLIPIFFLGNNISDCEGTVTLSIKFRFLIYYYSVAVFPGTLFFSLFVAVIARENPDRFVVPVMGLIGVLLLFGLFLTYLLSNSYQVPLVRMKRAAEKIRAGDYAVSVSVVSNDEVGALGEALNEMAAGLKDKEFISETFGKMVDPRVRDYLLRGHVHLGGEIKEATILFSDIMDFTAMSEQMRPDQVVYLLNRYFERMSECVNQENGLVNSFIGDGIMALFGIPVADENHAEAAVRAALKMHMAQGLLNEELSGEGLPPLLTRIGIHTGEVLAGNIGTRSRMEYTVIGDAVNVASRLEGLCKELGHGLIMSETTANLLGEEFEPEYLTTLTVRGKAQPIKLYYL